MRVLSVLMTIVLSAVSLTASDSTDKVLKQRRKAFKNCECYLLAAQKKSQLTVGVLSLKVTYESEPQTTVKPSDETVELGMKMQKLCQAFESDATMTTRDYLVAMQRLEDKQREIEKAVIGIQERLHFDVGVTAVQNEKKN